MTGLESGLDLSKRFCPVTQTHLLPSVQLQLPLSSVRTLISALLPSLFHTNKIRKAKQKSIIVVCEELYILPKVLLQCIGASCETHLRWFGGSFGLAKRSCVEVLSKGRTAKQREVLFLFAVSLSCVLPQCLSQFIYLLCSDTKPLIELRWSISRDNLMILRTARTCGATNIRVLSLSVYRHEAFWVTMS